MIKGNHLILTGENDIVFTYDCAAADRLNTDLLRITFLTCSGTIVFVMVCIAIASLIESASAIAVPLGASTF